VPDPPSPATLHADVDGEGPRLALVHGFTQTRECWGQVGTALVADHEVVRIDAPGHGRSAAARADLAGGAQLLADRVGRATYIGYSMGARLALHVALERPDAVAGLVMIGGTAGIADADARAARRAADEATAARLEREGLDAFLAAWLAQPLFAGLSHESRFVEERRDNTVAGLASSLRLAGTGAQAPLWDRLGAVGLPVLAVAGAADDKFAAEARRMAAAIGDNATVALVRGAGHAAHLERPDEFLGILRPWLAAHGL
jgi:2-succinyl-6-hydroxy-2,4-cyclohexadiene-1-carboxylate synthase